MFKKLLIISGPTATGKTALAVTIANKFNGELISADSRQIYRQLNIGVGKDHPSNIPIHLIDIVYPNQRYSVSQFRKKALEVITKIHQKKCLPIIVGCSGLYIDSLVNQNYNYFNIKPNLIFRRISNYFPLSLLQKLLLIVNRKTYLKLNNSDKNNPRRLIRKLEISLSFTKEKKIKNYFDILHISLTASNKYIYNKIDKRVEERIKLGHIKELTKLLTIYNWNDPGLEVSAYKCLQPYFNHQADLATCIQKWKFCEHRDARHQKTWFKKIKNIHFIDISQPYYDKKVIDLVSKWYN